MPRRSGKPRTQILLSPRAEWLIAALEVKDAAEERREAPAFRQLVEFALIEIPLRGVLAPDTDRQFKRIDEIAGTYFGFAAARQRWSDATQGVETFGLRDELQASSLEMLSISDTAHFYAGLAFGLALVDLGQGLVLPNQKTATTRR